MNCKPGDLAYIVWSVRGNEGKVVRCLRLFGIAIWDGEPLQTWETDYDFGVEPFTDPELRFCIPDDQLCPITPPPGSVTTDEVLELYAPRTDTPTPCPHKTKERA